MGQKDAGKKESEKATAPGDGGVTVVLTADLHCEGCAQKIKRSLKHFDGVETVKTDLAANKITVAGKVDPAKVKEKVEKKMKKKVELVSPQPPATKKVKDAGDGDSDGKKSDEKPVKKSPPADNDDNRKKEKKEPKEGKLTTVILKTKVHCDGCARKINKIISKYEGVKEVNVDQAKDEIVVKGTMNMTQILPYLNVKLKRVVEMVPPPKKEDKKAKDDESGGGDKKEKEVAKSEDGKGEKKKKEKTKQTPKGGGEGGSKAAEENVSNVEVVNRMEYSAYPNGFGAHTYNLQPMQGIENGYVMDYWNGPGNGHELDYMHAPPHYLHAPQMFSDENPNACSVM